jgi:hypothetical protein
MGIIVSTLVGCGKEELMEEFKGKVKFHDMTDETTIKELPPKNFVDDVMHYVDECDIVFVPTEQYILDEFERRNIDYDIFYPSKNRRQEIIIKLVGSRMPFPTIAKVDNNFNDWIDAIDENDSPNCFKHKMEKEGEFINNSEIIIEFLKTAINERSKKMENSSRSEDDAEERS